MNPYEKYYLRQKLLTGALLVGATALVTGGVMLWQPWNATTPDDDSSITTPVEDTDPVQDEISPDLSITVGGKKVDCFLYQGDGWSIPYPVDWSVQESEDSVSFLPPQQSTAALSVSLSQPADYQGSFIAAYGDNAPLFERAFYYGDAIGYTVSCQMPRDAMDDFEKTMTAMARTMTVGENKPFASLYPMASEPEWQIIDGETILFMDKDGIDLASVAQTAISSYMNGWDNAVKANFSGQSQFDAPVWVGSYTCVTDDFIDVFAVTPQYQIAAGKAASIVLEEGQSLQNGWLVDGHNLLYIALYHDGSSVNKTAALWHHPPFRGVEFVNKIV